MTNRSSKTSPLVLARVAGILGFSVLPLGSFAGYVNNKLVVVGDAATTAQNILASETLFRLGFVSGLAMYAVFIPYALVLYQLLERVNKSQARLMLVLALVGVPIAMINQVHQSAALLLLSGADYLQVFSAEQIHAQVMLFLELHKHGALVGVIFWGLWLFPLGWLVFKSGCFPRVLGVLLMIGCFGWLIVFLQRFLFPGFEAMAASRFAAHVAELSWGSWLVIKGVNVERWNALAREST